MTTTITFKGKDGSEVSGALAEPQASGKAPTLVLIQEYWGINDHVKSLADRLANDGFLVLAPDLYHGTIAKDAAEAGGLMQALNWPQAIKEIGAAVDFLRADPRGNGKVGVIGFCMGGALTFAAACQLGGLSAVVPYYGVPAPENADYTKVTAPVLAHFAKNDGWATVEKAEGIKKVMDANGKTMTLEVYDAGHAFTNDTRPEAYNEAAAKLAWQRSVDFLKKNVA